MSHERSERRRGDGRINRNDSWEIISGNPMKLVWSYKIIMIVTHPSQEGERRMRYDFSLFFCSSFTAFAALFPTASLWTNQSCQGESSSKWHVKSSGAIFCAHHRYQARIQPWFNIELCFDVLNLTLEGSQDDNGCSLKSPSDLNKICCSLARREKLTSSRHEDQRAHLWYLFIFFLLPQKALPAKSLKSTFWIFNRRDFRLSGYIFTAKEFHPRRVNIYFAYIVLYKSVYYHNSLACFSEEKTPPPLNIKFHFSANPKYENIQE